MEATIEQSQTADFQGETPLGEQWAMDVQIQEQSILNRVLALSLEEQTRSFHSKGNGLTHKHRKMLKNQRMDRSSRKCTVCLDSFVKNEIIKQLPCKHIFHSECAKTWLKEHSTCPVCRLDL